MDYKKETEMKITKQQLKQIIKEELGKVLAEDSGDFESHKQRILQTLQKVPFQGEPSEDEVKKIQNLLNDYYNVEHRGYPRNKLTFLDTLNNIEIVYDYLDDRWTEN